MTHLSDSIPIIERGGHVHLNDLVSVSFVCVLDPPTTASLHAITDTLLAIGSIKWNLDMDGEVGGISVREDWQRKGVAQLLWNVATGLAEERGWFGPSHSPNRTAAGDAFARSIGGPLPPLAGGEFELATDGGFLRTDRDVLDPRAADPGDAE